MTPAQLAGFKEGDRAKVLSENSVVANFSEVELYHDDESNNPWWKIIKGTAKVPGSLDKYPIRLSLVHKIRKEEHRITPSEQAGFQVGDQAVVTISNGVFPPGATVKLIHDDGTHYPRWQILSDHESCDGDDNGFVHIQYFKKINKESEEMQTVAQVFPRNTFHVVILESHTQAERKRTKGEVYKVKTIVPDANGDLSVCDAPGYIRADKAALCNEDGELLNVGFTNTREHVRSRKNVKVYVPEDVEESDLKEYAGGVYPVEDANQAKDGLFRLRGECGDSAPVPKRHVIVVEGSWEDAPTPC